MKTKLLPAFLLILLAAGKAHAMGWVLFGSTDCYGQGYAAEKPKDFLSPDTTGYVWKELFTYPLNSETLIFQATEEEINVRENGCMGTTYRKWLRIPRYTVEGWHCVEREKEWSYESVDCLEEWTRYDAWLRSTYTNYMTQPTCRRWLVCLREMGFGSDGKVYWRKP